MVLKAAVPTKAFEELLILAGLAIFTEANATKPPFTAIFVTLALES